VPPPPLLVKCQQVSD